jgi:hypothetical protein
MAEKVSRESSLTITSSANLLAPASTCSCRRCRVDGSSVGEGEATNSERASSEAGVDASAVGTHIPAHVRTATQDHDARHDTYAPGTPEPS